MLCVNVCVLCVSVMCECCVLMLCMNVCAVCE